jgi:hypothetical protein
LAVGDRVTFTNDYGDVFGPHKVLSFENPINDRYVYIDNYAYWFSDRSEQLAFEKTSE